MAAQNRRKKQLVAFDMDLEAFVPAYNLLDALSNCLLLRAAGCHAPAVLGAFWEVPCLSQMVSAEGTEIVIGYAVLAESRKGALPWKALLQLAPDLKR